MLISACLLKEANLHSPRFSITLLAGYKIPHMISSEVESISL